MVVAVGLQALMTSRLVVDYGIRQLLDRRRGGDAQPDPGGDSGDQDYLIFIIEYKAHRDQI